jgi:CBS domain-containing protein
VSGSLANGPSGTRSILNSAVTPSPSIATLDPDRLAPYPTDPAVSEVMRDEVVFCLPSTPMDAVAKLMADNDLREICVLLDRRPVGYVTAESVVGLLADGKVVVSGSDFAARPPATTARVTDVMQPAPLLVDESQRVSEVAAVMAQNKRRLAVVMHDDETPVGMVTALELADFALRQRNQSG